MFSYVAKSLLSKTLRTFLRKYLENIELESIDYGTTSSTASAGNNSGKSQNAGGSSGWGVRLSNVKLREGMELVKLPGKRKRVVTRKKKVKRNKGKKTSVAVALDIDATPVTKNSKKTIKVELEGGEVFHALLPMVNGAADTSASEENTMSTSSAIDGEKPGVILHAAETLPLHLHEKLHNRHRLSSSDTENGYFSSTPTTPTQSRHGICGVPSTFCLNAKSRVAMESQKEMDVKKLSLPFDEKDSNGDMPAVDVNGASYTKETVIEKTNLGQEKPTESNFTAPNSAEPSATSPTSTDESNDLDDDDESFIEIEEEFVVEDDMALVVGAGGVIGTLNIRLVGKELHVTVEDAHLIVEAVPSESISDEGKESSKTSKPTKPANLDRSTSSPSEADLSSLVDENKDETTFGEKIKKKSMLAKYLTLIPHLFLRDCRVSLILPEDMGDDESTEATKDDCEDCTIFELGIDFLSVTSGDDFLDVLRFDTGSKSPEATPPKSQPYSFRRSSTVESETPSSNSERKHLGRLNSQCTQNNVFSRKRIRTGKGPEGGVWLKIYPPHGRITRPQPKWARRRFLDSSESFFLRCSGLDLHARMLVDVKTEDGELDEIGDVWSNEYDEYTLDSMLFGVDYVDPISLTRHQIKENMRRERISKPLSDEASDVVNDTDQNGIQTVPFASNFHWIAQRAHRSDCANCHLPLNDCFHCWDACVQQKPMSISSMNSLMPLPGFVFCLSVADPLEVNVDRSSLEALGYMKSLLTSKKPTTDDDEQENAHDDTYANTTEGDLGKGDEAPSINPWTFDDKSFPSFMQPDAIYLSGLYVSKIIIRVEAIQSRIDSGLRFRFWQFIGQSIQCEESQVDAEEHFLRDITFHVGSVECKDFTGVCETKILVAGMHLSKKSDEQNFCQSEVLLPCTASRVLGVSFPTEKRINKSYAAHARVIRSDVQKVAVGEESASISKVGFVNLQMGMVDVNMKNTLSGDMSKAFGEASSIFTSGPKKATKSKPNSQGVLNWLYQVSTVGGTLSYQPRVKMKIPESKFRARRGSEGFSFEAFLHGLGIEYGSYNFGEPLAPSIIHLCSLPESLRMHILLHLDDLTSLEKVLNIKRKKSSAFLRSHAVNKKLSKLGVSSAKEKIRCQTEVSRRNDALSRLQSLDIDSLEAILAMHNRSHHNMGNIDY